MLLLKETCYDFARSGHRAQALTCVCCFTDSTADIDIPVTRPWNDQLTYEEDMIDHVECVNDASPLHRYDCKADFALRRSRT